MTDCDGMKCFLFDGCSGKTAGCRVCGPDDDGCPVYRWFKEKLIVRCKDCKYYIDGTGVCDLYHAHGCAETWYCADGERR